nr:MAG TPA: hypothetical protein [Caudoviricetes sp.]
MQFFACQLQQRSWLNRALAKRGNPSGVFEAPLISSVELEGY